MSVKQSFGHFTALDQNAYLNLACFSFPLLQNLQQRRRHREIAFHGLDVLQQPIKRVAPVISNSQTLTSRNSDGPSGGLTKHRATPS
jgi:hypothetical protein